jgi:hypothetical protein
MMKKLSAAVAATAIPILLFVGAGPAQASTIALDYFKVNCRNPMTNCGRVPRSSRRRTGPVAE